VVTTNFSPRREKRVVTSPYVKPVSLKSPSTVLAVGSCNREVVVRPAPGRCLLTVALCAFRLVDEGADVAGPPIVRVEINATTESATKDLVLTSGSARAKRSRPWCRS